MSTDTAIRVHSLEKAYGKVAVLHGVDFDVARAASSPCSAPTAQARPPS